MWDILAGMAGSGLIAALAYWKRSLSGSGAAAAVLVGTVLYAWGSAVWFGLMIVFFITSTMLTKWKHSRKAAAEAVYQKSGRRDAGQVLANGGAGAVLCAAASIWPEASASLLAAYMGIMATVTADTWATEVGGLSRRLPRSMITWQQVPAGTSGGVTLWGWSAAAAGGFVIGLSAWLLMYAVPEPAAAFGRLVQPENLWWTGLVMLSGWMGANADSLLGAVLQAMYRCRVCGRETEAATHCGEKVQPVRGIRWLDNDAVNVISSLVGGMICFLLLHSLQLL